MPGLFDEFSSEFDDSNLEESHNDGVAAQVVQSLYDDDDIDDELAEAEKRLAKAAYYKAILRDGVVNEDGTEHAAEVNSEFRAFCRQMMGKLLGIVREQPPQKVDLPFTEIEINALKSLAKQALLMGMVKDDSPPEPTVRKVSQPDLPQVRKQSEPPTPKVRKQGAKKKPVVQTKLHAKPQPQAQEKQPVQAKTEKPASAAKKPIKPKVNSDGEFDYDSIPTGKEFTEKDGTVWKFVDNPNFDPNDPNSKPRAKIKVTGQVRPSTAVPMPTGHQLEAITHSQSVQAVNNITSANPVFVDENSRSDLLIAAAARSMANE
jgi:hypothetical protein